MNKRGSHVDVIISFVIFVALIVFLYVILQPTLATQNSRSSLQSTVKENLINSMSDSLTSMNVKVYETQTADCVRLIDFLNNTGLKPANIYVQNVSQVLNDKQVFSSISNQGQNYGNDLFLDGAFSGTTGATAGIYFFKIYNASEFSTINSNNLGQGTCPEVNPQPISGNPNYYTIGQTRTEKIVFETSIVSVWGEYTNSYSSYQILKESLGIPAGEDFGFEFIYPDSNRAPLVAMRSNSPNVNIYSETVPVTYMSISGEIKEGKMIISVW